MIDCLIIGFNDGDFAEHVAQVRAMGEDSGAYRDLRLAFVEHGGAPRRALDLLNDLRAAEGAGGARYHNADFLWPVVLYLGTYLARRGHSFDYVNLFHLEKAALRDKLLGQAVRVVAITTTLYVTPTPIEEIIAFVRASSPGVKIVVGGPFVANQAKMLPRAELLALFAGLGADAYAISQEGEATLAALVSALKTGAPLEAVPNLAVRTADGFALTPPAEEDNPLSENMVDYALFPRAAFGEFVSVRTAKSCPYACSFCSFPQRAGAYAYLDVDRVEQELDALRAIGTVTTVSFLDDTFNVPPKRFKEILRMMIRRRYGFRWSSFFRADQADDETIDLMRESGCEGVFLGMESGSDRVLRQMNKTARTSHYRWAIPRLKRAGILAHANLIVGFPGETRETHRETRDFIEETAPDFYRAQLWYCDPITPIWARRLELGIRGSGFRWRHATMTSEEACDLVDDLFLSVEGSTWLPQHGFEMWSVFYLRRKGMTDAEIFGFLRRFNASVAARIRGPARAVAGDEDERFDFEGDPAGPSAGSAAGRDGGA